MSNNGDWKNQKEIYSTVLGIKFVLWIYDVLGVKLTRACLYLIVAFYWIFARKQREFSKKYIQILKNYAKQKDLTLPKMTTFAHFMSFSESLLDKLLCWSGKITISDLNIKHIDFDKSSRKGILILGSHLGNIEVCRALSELSENRKVHILIQMEQTKVFNGILQSLNQQSQVNLISISEISPQTIMFLKEALDEGDIVTILADRLPFNDYQRDRTHLFQLFLGELANFPKGPFVLALLLQVPTFFLVAAKHQGKFDFYLNKIDVPVDEARQKRQKNLEILLQQYVGYLEAYTVKYPMQWYNFYNFWQQIDQNHRNKNENKKFN